MVIGHFAAGLIGKNVNMDIPVWIYFVAVLLPDILSIPFIIFPSDHIDRVFWTHGLVPNVVMAVLVLIITIIITKKISNGLILGGLVMSHWILDFISWPIAGRGLPLFSTGLKEVGLGLYTTSIGLIVGEVVGLLLLIFFAFKLTIVDKE